MKKKLLVIILVIVLACSSAFVLLSCKKDKDDAGKNPTDGTKVNITVLPDMVDYGAPSYYEVNAVNYDDKLEKEWINELTEKRSDEREYWLDDDKWDNAKYYTFGPVALAYGESEEKRQSNIGYFYSPTGKAEDAVWVTDESANTVERIFCYSEPEDIINRFSLAAIDSVKTDGIVKYIARDDADPDRPKGTGYSYTIGVDSAIEDYAQLEELQEIYDDFEAYRDDESYTKHIFATEDDAYDALSLKQRKVYGEIFAIFGDDAAQFARAAIAMSAYAIKVVESVMLPAYENAIGEIASDNEFIEYMRNEVYDYDTLSYMLAFREFTSLDAKYIVTKKTDAMSLFGYHYQYKLRDYRVFDDSVKKTYEGKEITEYEYFLKLSHKSYFENSQEALDYRNYDRRQYEQAYRYSVSCYEKYYEKQLNFQALQEENETTLYCGGHNNRFSEGMGYYNGSLSSTGSGVTTYTREMQEALSMGFEATLKLSDVNWEYTGVDNNVLRYNAANTNWNKLTDEQQENSTNKIYYVRLELEQLKSQDYSINHATITNADLTKALKYQIKSYSADSIRGIQANKKDEVLYQKDIDRFFTVLEMTEESFESSTSTPVYQKDAYAALQEDLGRNYAKYRNLEENFSYGNVTSQITTADSADWPGVKSNIKETLAVDYETYHTNSLKASGDINPVYVDQYFEDTLIKKTYSCGGTFDECLDPNAPKGSLHPNCTTEYDTDWALSRLVNSHEVVMRYMYGQIEVTFYMIPATDIKKADVFTQGPTGSTSADAIAGKWYNISSTAYTTYTTKNIMSDEEIGTVCRSDYTATSYDMYWMNTPSYDSSDIKESTSRNMHTLTIMKGGAEYTYTFYGWYVDENFQYRVNLDEEIDYDIRLYPCYRMSKTS